MDELSNFIANLGAVSEMSLAFFRAAKQSGASDNEAYLLSKAFLEAAFSAFGTDPPKSEQKQPET